VQNERGDDLIADTVMKIIEVVRLGPRPFPFARYERAGLPAFIVLYDEVRTAARRHRRIRLVNRPTQLPVQTFPSPEQVLLEQEHRAELASFPKRLAARLTRRQQAWLQAFLTAAEEGGGALSEAAAALDVHKSQATRAADRIAAIARRHRLLDGLEPKKRG